MAWLAIIVAVAGAAATLLDLRWATGLLLVAAGFATVALVREQRLWTPRVAVAVVLAGALFASWAAWQLHRPEPTHGPDPARYARAGITREVLLPLTVEVAPITALALLPLEPGSDDVYNGFEPQVINTGNTRGFQVIAYRNDGLVDIYLDHSLVLDPNDTSDVTGEGLNQLVQTDLGDPRLEVDDRGRAHISFAFTDVLGRQVGVQITEATTRRSAPTDILAPIGVSSATPAEFPLFLMNDFEFIRTSGAVLEVSIDGLALQFEPFPVPLPVQGQRRSFAKYTLDPEIISVFPTRDTRLRSAPTAPGSDVAEVDGVRYLFAGDALERIWVNDTEIVFEPALDLARSSTGRIEITSYPRMGLIAGRYEVRTSGPSTELTMGFDEVEVPHQRDLLYSMVVRNGSMFSEWPKQYRYTATIDRDAGTIDARWVNEAQGTR